MTERERGRIASERENEECEHRGVGADIDSTHERHAQCARTHTHTHTHTHSARDDKRTDETTCERVMRLCNVRLEETQQ